MIKFNLNANVPGGGREELSFEVQWPVLPRVGDIIDIALPGEEDFGSHGVVVSEVRHWLGCGDVDVYCVFGGADDAAIIQAYDNLAADPKLNRQVKLGIWETKN